LDINRLSLGTSTAYVVVDTDTYIVVITGEFNVVSLLLHDTKRNK